MIRTFYHIFGSILLTALLSSAVFGQSSLFEWLIEHEAAVSGQSAALDFLENLENSPVHINSASPDEIMTIPGITMEQAKSIVQRRLDEGDFQSPVSVKSAGKIDDAWFELISPYIVLQKEPIRFGINIRQRGYRVIERQRGFDNGSYPGSVYRNYTRMKLKYNDNITGGFLAEKDPGELSITDHSVWYLDWTDDNNKLKITAGYYSLSFGQGLLFSRYGMFGKGQDPVYPISRKTERAGGFLSSVEYEGFRGAAATLTDDRFTVTFFVSNTSRDAVINEESFVSSLPVTGYHRTDTEKNNLNRLNERLNGARLKFAAADNLSLGLTGAAIKYDQPFLGDKAGKPLMKFSGKSIGLIGTDFTVSFDNIHVFSELGFSEPGAYGFIGGMIWNNKSTRFGILFRDYREDFYSPFGGAFADRRSENRNERGAYFGLKHRISKSTQIFFYADVFENPWMTYMLPARSSAVDLFGQVLYKINPRHTVTVNLKHNKNAAGVKYFDEAGIDRKYYTNAIDNRFRVQLDSKISGNLKLTGRFDVRKSAYETLLSKVYNQPSKDPGLHFHSRFTYGYIQNIRISGGFSVFSTNGYGFYQYEPDLPGMMKISQFYGEGERFFALVNYKVNLLTLSCKYGIIHYKDRGTIGSGSAAINKSYKQEFGIQLDFSY